MRLRSLPRQGLYALVDTVTLDARSIDVVAFGRAVLAARPALLQLRAKNRSANETLALLRLLGPLAEAADVPFFANDRPDLAALAGLPGVHVGQEDLSVAEVRRAFPNLLVGVSTHNINQVDEALAAGPDYLAFGPIYPTASKDDPDPVVGLTALAQIVERASSLALPVVAIGGLDFRPSAPGASTSRLHEVAARGAIPAVISALLPAAGPDGSLSQQSEKEGFFAAVTARVRQLDEAVRRASLGRPGQTR
jgi:thiamine-phosphate pyrophosphorylase